MEALSIFGLFAFCLVFSLQSRVGRLEKMVRESGILQKSAASLAEQLREDIGSLVRITQAEGVNLDCTILDVDEDWVLLEPKRKRNAHKKGVKDADDNSPREGEMLLRLTAVQSVRRLS